MGKYSRRLKRGASLTERFWAKVAKRGPDECWLWTGAHTGTGYGNFMTDPQIFAGAHLVSYELAHGPISSGQDVCHRCDNPPCVNPAHLFLGTRKDNMADMKRKDRSSRGERHHNAKLTAAQVMDIRSAIAEGAMLKTVADRFGICIQHACDINRRKKWAHVP